MAKWNVSFQGNTESDERYVYDVVVDCHWAYNAPKVGFKQLTAEQQKHVEAECASIGVCPAK